MPKFPSSEYGQAIKVFNTLPGVDSETPLVDALGIAERMRTEAMTLETGGWSVSSGKPSAIQRPSGLSEAIERLAWLPNRPPREALREELTRIAFLSDEARELFVLQNTLGTEYSPPSGNE